MSLSKINTRNLFPRILESCRVCDTCCKTYGWLLKKEAKKFIKKKYPVIKINNVLFCIDSFKRDKRENLILGEIPRCRFYGKRECLIQKDKPLDCKLFPIKLRFYNDFCVLGLSLGCKYVSSLNEKERKNICQKTIKFIKKMRNSDLDEYINLMQEVSSISQPKKFWMKKLIGLKKEGNSWKIINLFA
jgi:Fe-S-cluster containining protein